MEPAAPSPLDALRQRLVDAPAPLPLKDATKGLAKSGKKAPPAPDFVALLDAEIRDGRVWKYPSGSKGADRYWTRDEKAVAGRAVREAAAEPRKLTDLKKVAKDVTKGDKAFADAVVDEMVAAGQLHEHPGKKPLFGREKPPARNDKTGVAEALLAAALTPAKLADLIKAAQAATPSDKDFVTAVAQELIAGGRLHKQAEGKTAPYGRERPSSPHPLDAGKGKTAFTKLVTDARKLLDVGVTATDLIERLRAALSGTPAPPTTAPPAAVTKPSPALAAPVAPAPVREQTSHVPAPEAVRTGLKAAYEELRRDIEFQDGPVELGALYHEAKHTLPALTVDAFHRELLHLQQQRVVELHPLNEVQRAKEPELAIRSGDRLLYFAIWR